MQRKVRYAEHGLERCEISVHADLLLLRLRRLRGRFCHSFSPSHRLPLLGRHHIRLQYSDPNVVHCQLHAPRLVRLPPPPPFFEFPPCPASGEYEPTGANHCITAAHRLRRLPIRTLFRSKAGEIQKTGRMGLSRKYQPRALCIMRDSKRRRYTTTTSERISLPIEHFQLELPAQTQAL